ncbi:head GIN domain-containing protein [uncultured Muriicola sp.]|uniref:head GIN domain-containing protein n=1 Tax=uncultured Muriicola sp. TaxID=1583102 RepID=UPI0026376229|nr:head GIN domain-containing protein [uncultured Muriicola sp.]
MTTLARIAIAVLMALFLSSCAFDMNFGEGKRGNGEVAKESREVYEEFTEISAAEGLDVYVTQGDNFNIEVEADENIIELIGGRATKKIHVSLPSVTGLYASSGADLYTQNVIRANKISLDASSGAGIKVALVADEVDADTSSGADIRIEGEAVLFYADASSGSDIKAKDFAVRTCHADASSGADISVNVSETLIADASSGADISYSGNPDVQKKKSYSGSVHKD